MALGDDLLGDPLEPVAEPPGGRRRNARRQQQAEGGDVAGGPAGVGGENTSAAGGCPPGQQMINGRCRHAGDFPCPPNQCKDKVTGECRSFNPRREKPNETDDIERESGGGRGYCKQLESGGGGGGGDQLANEQAYFDRLVAQGDWTPVGGGWFWNDPGNDPSRRVWVNRNTLQLDATGRGYQSVTDAQYKQMGQPGGPARVSAGPTGGSGGFMGGLKMPGQGGPSALTRLPGALTAAAPGGPAGGSMTGAPPAGPRPAAPGMAVPRPGVATAPGAPTTPGTPAPGPGGGDIATQIQNALTSIFQGSTRFSPEVMDDITAGQKLLEQSQIQQGISAANEDAAARGLAFSGVGAAAAGEARSKAQATFAQGQREARQQKAFYDFEDKMTGLTKAQQYLDSLRQYSLGLEANAIQREQIQASILIARERIAAEAQQLMQQLASQRDLAGMQIDSNEWIFMQGQLRCLMNPDLC